jgi:hypothetical protein
VIARLLLVDEPKRGPVLRLRITRQRDGPGSPNEDGPKLADWREKVNKINVTSPKVSTTPAGSRRPLASAASRWGAAAQDQRACGHRWWESERRASGGRRACRARRSAWDQRLEPGAQDDLQAPGKESGEVVRFDAVLKLVAIGRYRSSLRFLNATSISTSWM